MPLTQNQAILIEILNPGRTFWPSSLTFGNIYLEDAWSLVVYEKRGFS